MKKIVIIIVAVLVVIGIGFGVYDHEASATTQAKNITSTSSEITNYTNLTNKFFDSLNHNNFKEFQSVTSSKLGTKEYFTESQKFFENYGTFNSIHYVETISIEGLPQVIFRCDFSKNPNLNIRFALNKNNKIEGFFKA